MVRRFARTLTLCLALAGAGAARAQAWIWPLSGTAVADPMNTSFGPRINYSAWDFHDGIDLPTTRGAPVKAVAAGTVFREGPGGTDGISSRHVVLQIAGPGGVTLFAYYLHLDSIDGAISESGAVAQGQTLGGAGDDDATYVHLHFEVRRNASPQINSVHPLEYLPYSDTANFGAPALDRQQASVWGRLVRFTFAAAAKNEGDLRRVEFECFQGATSLGVRAIELDDKMTVREGTGDGLMWTNDLALEGYQRSDMVADGRTDLRYGILARALPAGCDTAVARAIDWGGHVAASPPVPLGAAPAGFSALADFEDGQSAPAGWSVFTSSNGTGTSVANQAAAARNGARGLNAIDASTSEGASQTASAGLPIPAGRLQWAAEGWFAPQAVAVASTQNGCLLELSSGTGVSACAGVRDTGGGPVAGLVVRDSAGTTRTTWSAIPVATGVWRRWSLAVTRIGTRESTAALYLDGVEAVRRQWEAGPFEADGFRGGVGFTSAGAALSTFADDLRIDDGGLGALPAFRPGRVDGNGLRAAKSGAADLALNWSAGCGPGGVDYAVYEGALGGPPALHPRLCSTAGATAATVTPAAGSRFLLVLAKTAAGAGPPGYDSFGVPEPPAPDACDDAIPPGC